MKYSVRGLMVRTWLSWDSDQVCLNPEAELFTARFPMQGESGLGNSSDGGPATRAGEQDSSGRSPGLGTRGPGLTSLLGPRLTV